MGIEGITVTGLTIDHTGILAGISEQELDLESGAVVSDNVYRSEVDISGEQQSIVLLPFDEPNDTD